MKIVKELKKITNIDFEKDKYGEIRDIVTTIVHNRMNAASPMDVDKKVIMIRNAVHFLGFQTIDRKRQNTFEFDRKSVFESSKFGLENGLLIVLNCILPFYHSF